MRTVVKLPIGIEDIEEICTEGFYYADKTGLITELLNNWGKGNPFCVHHRKHHQAVPVKHARSSRSENASIGVCCCSRSISEKVSAARL